jgi:hypothetical protein
MKEMKGNELTNVSTGATITEISVLRYRKYGKDAAVVEKTIKPHSFKAFSF